MGSQISVGPKDTPEFKDKNTQSYGLALCSDYWSALQRIQYFMICSGDTKNSKRMGLNVLCVSVVVTYSKNHEVPRALPRRFQQYHFKLEILPFFPTKIPNANRTDAISLHIGRICQTRKGSPTLRGSPR